MAGLNSSPATTIKLFFILFLVITVSSPSPIFVNGFAFPFYFSQYKTLISISRFLLLRIANLRDSRGDALGSSRVRAMAEEIDRGLGFLSRDWSVGWDYRWNYAWRKEGIDYGEVYGAIGDLNELMGLVTEFNRAESNADKAICVARNYGKALRVSKQLLRRLLRIFGKSGALREFWEMVQAEVVDGELLQGIDYGEVYGAIGDLNELMGLVTEFNRAESNADKATCVARTYGKALRVSKQLLRLLRIFGKLVRIQNPRKKMDL